MEMHSTVRAAILPEIIAKIMDKYSVDENTALDMFYRSATGESYADDETGLYGQSANFVFGLFVEEKQDLHRLLGESLESKKASKTVPARDAFQELENQLDIPEGDRA